MKNDVFYARVYVDFIRDRDDTYLSPFEQSKGEITPEEVIKWLADTPLYVHSNISSTYNKQFDESDISLLLNKLTNDELVRFYIKHDPIDKCLSLDLLYIYARKTFILTFDPWNNKEELMVALDMSRYFNHLLDAGSDGLIDKNYLKNFV